MEVAALSALAALSATAAADGFGTGGPSATYGAGGREREVAFAAMDLGRASICSDATGGATCTRVEESVAGTAVAVRAASATDAVDAVDAAAATGATGAMIAAADDP
jgi:hypothetical protein